MAIQKVLAGEKVGTFATKYNATTDEIIVSATTSGGTITFYKNDGNTFTTTVTVSDAISNDAYSYSTWSGDTTSGATRQAVADKFNSIDNQLLGFLPLSGDTMTGPTIYSSGITNTSSAFYSGVNSNIKQGYYSSGHIFGSAAYYVQLSGTVGQSAISMYSDTNGNFLQYVGQNSSGSFVIMGLDDGITQGGNFSINRSGLGNTFKFNITSVGMYLEYAADTKFLVNPVSGDTVIIKGATSNNTTKALSVKDSSNIEYFYLRNDGTVNIKGPVETSSSSILVFNSNATTVNAFGAATDFNIGAITGIMSLRNPIIVGSNSSQELFNAVTTTMDFAGITTTLNIGNISTATKTLSLFGGATISGNTKTLNIGIAGVSGSTTNINLGSSVSGATGTISIYHNTTITGIAQNALTVNNGIRFGSNTGTSVSNGGSVMYSGTTFYGSDNTNWNSFVSATGSTITVGSPVTNGSITLIIDGIPVKFMTTT